MLSPELTGSHLIGAIPRRKILQLRHIRSLENRLQTSLTLSLIVLQHRNNLRSHQQNRRQVHNHHAGIQHIRGSPHQIQRRNRAEEHKHQNQRTENGHRQLTLSHETHIRLAVVVVTNHSRERKHENSDSQEVNRPIAQLHSQSRLSQRRATRTIAIGRVRK